MPFDPVVPAVSEYPRQHYFSQSVGGAHTHAAVPSDTTVGRPPFLLWLFGGEVEF